MPGYHPAQMNIARLVEPIDSPRLAEFIANLDRINALADDAPGFVWRLQTEECAATAIRGFGEDRIVNLSVWKDIASLHRYVYRPDPIDVMRRRKEWFEKMQDAYLVPWRLPAGLLPTVIETKARLQTLQSKVPSQAAFTFKRPYPPPERENRFGLNRL
jgi:hypothetical protein